MKLFTRIISTVLCIIMLAFSVSCAKPQMTDDGVKTEILTHSPSEDQTSFEQTSPTEKTEVTGDTAPSEDTEDDGGVLQQTDSDTVGVPNSGSEETKPNQTDGITTQSPQTQLPNGTPTAVTDTPRVMGVYNCAADRVIIFGSCEWGSTVTSWGENGVKEYNLSGNGYFYVEQSTSSPGQVITLTATAPDKSPSEPTRVNVSYNAEVGMNVFGGRDSRLFLQTTLPFYLGQVQASEKTLDAAKQYLINLRQTVCTYTGKDTKFIYVIAPNPVTVYYDGVRDYILDAVSGEQQKTAAWQFVQTMQDVDGFIVPDLYDEFAKVRDEDIFYRTDTHWSELGAFYAYSSVISHIKRDFPRTPVYSLSDFDVVYEDCYAGDLASTKFLNASDLRETVPFLYPKFKSVGAYYTARRQSGKSIGVAVAPYPETSSIRGSNLASCYFVSDSYGANFLPYAGMSFGKMFANEGVMWNYTLDTELLKTEKPDYVMFIYTDRNIDENLSAVFTK